MYIDVNATAEAWRKRVGAERKHLCENLSTDRLALKLISLPTGRKVCGKRFLTL